MQSLDVRGIRVYKGFLSSARQKELLKTLRAVIKEAPLISLKTSRGKPMSVRTSSAGKFGWYADSKGYRYERKHPSGKVWPDIPDDVLDVWKSVSGVERLPDCCLINFYGEGARMGLHQDKDEADFQFPVVSVSLGDSGLFRIGEQQRKGSTESIWLESGDVCVMGGDARLKYHGVDRIRFGSSGLLANGGRLNLTMRVVT